jgi:hypothetical protein
VSAVTELFDGVVKDVRSLPVELEAQPTKTTVVRQTASRIMIFFMGSGGASAGTLGGAANRGSLAPKSFDPDFSLLDTQGYVVLIRPRQCTFCLRSFQFRLVRIWGREKTLKSWRSSADNPSEQCLGTIVLGAQWTAVQ